MTRGWMEALDVHERRRRQGVPTVTMLAGPAAIGAAVFGGWLEAARRPAVVARGAAVTPGSVLEAYAGILPREAWRERAAASVSTTPEELLRALDRKSPAERALAVDALPQAGAAARALLLGEPARAALGLAALHFLFPRGAAPGVLLVGDLALATAARTAALLVEDVAELSVAVAGAGDPHDAGDRACALLREATVTVTALTPAGMRDALAAELREVAHAAEAQDDGARSAAERFLARCLELMAETAGRFVLNADPGFQFGGRRAEVDLLAPELHIAVEIDGWRHFQDEESYRRDRRKDLELQRHGYLVLRFLAADVVPRLEVILSTITQAVRRAVDPRR